MKLVFFRTPKPRQFRHTPIYYDERKDELKQILVDLEANVKKEGEPYTPNIRGKFRDKRLRASSQYSKDETRKSNIRLFILIILLMMVAYYFFVSGVEVLSKLKQ